jgi:hypothetical protein
VAHHHLIVRVPHLPMHGLILLDYVNRHGEEAKLPSEGRLLLMRSRRHHWRRPTSCDQRIGWSDVPDFVLTMCEGATVLIWAVFP